MKECTIQIVDEVNAKIINLDPDIRRKLAAKFSYEVPGAKFTPAVRLGRWNGKESFFSISGLTYINLLPDIIPIIDQAGYDFVLDDRRDYKRTFNFDLLSETSFDHRRWPEGHAMAGEPIILRDYQVEAVNKFLANPQCLQELATGFGKTVTVAAMSATVEKYGRSIVVVPNKSLVTQTEADYIAMGLDVSVYFGDRKEAGRTHTICTWQSLNNLYKKTKESEADIPIGEFIEDVVCLIIDEAHMIKGSALKSLLTGPLSQIPIRWGLTGTIPKEEYAFKSLQVSIGEVIGKLTASELQDMGHLANCHVNIVQLIDHKEFPDYQKELKYLVDTDGRLASIATVIQRIKQDGNTLVLVDRVSTGKKLIELLGDDAVFVSGQTKAKNRKAEYDEVASSESKIIVATYGVAAVGINIPRLFNIVLVEPGKSFVRVIQSIGRGLRKAHDKDNVEIYDITSTCKFSKRHLSKRIEYYKAAGYPYSKEKVDWQLPWE